MSMDRNVWIYGAGLLIVVGGCFAIGYTVLPTKPAFSTKPVAAAPATVQQDAPAPVTQPQPSVPKLVIEDITDEKVASTKPIDEPAPVDPEPTSTSPEELDIKVDTDKKTDSGDTTPEPATVDTQTPTSPAPTKTPKPTQTPKNPPVVVTPKQDAKSQITPPVDDSVSLFRVRIATIKPTRKEASALVSELKDKGFSATILPLAGSFVVQTGAFKDRRSAEALQRTLTDNGYDTSITN